MSSESILKGVTNFWQNIVCAKLEFQEWHALDYIKGKCLECGMKLLKICPLEKDLEHEIFLNWKCFQEVPTKMTKTSQPKIVIHLEHIQSQCLEYLDFMGPKFTILLLLSKTISTSCAWQINHQIVLFPMLILLKIIHSWNK